MEWNTLSNLFLPKEGIRKRQSSYDKSGGNDDRWHIASGERRTFFLEEGPAIVEHIWITVVNEGDVQEEHALRKAYLEFFFEDEDRPSVQVPLGDFFGLGHGRAKNFVSAPLQMSPEDGRGLNCYFPMPFRKRCRMDVVNECEAGLMFYFYVDYQCRELPDDILYFGATYHQARPEVKSYKEYKDRGEFLFGGFNQDGKDNYLILDVKGRGHYVGCHLDILNDSDTPDWDWPGEGDDMIFIDGEERPSIHGTGTEDYFSTAWCPTQEYSAPYHGIILGGEKNWKGEISYYRYHILDPITFKKEIKVTIEHGHANHRSDALTSTAYFYLDRPYRHEESILPVLKRLPGRKK